jgi:cephalosporin-C deacetylase-like acetyl esterase
MLMLLRPWIAACLGFGLLGLAVIGTTEVQADLHRGQQLCDDYFRRETQRLTNACLTGIHSKEDWERKRPELRRQFLEMIGLWPLPARTDLKPAITGRVEGEHFTIEKLHFQSSPGLYVTANFYLPKRAVFPAPAVLYLCGHANTVVDTVSYGSKVNYQHHPTWFAEHGYVCLILDTLELGEIEGIHHGTHDLNLWWWQTVGYTPAGIECWNAMRALDYLQTRKEVDPQKIGVTGRSGGGATSWWLAAADERPQCIVPVAGIADLQAHVVEGVASRYRKGVISGHCDCMYFLNTYQWDFPEVAALCAPRPLLLGNSTADDIFPVAGYRRLVDKVRRIYDLYGAGEKFALLQTAGPHKDTPELRRGAYRWMNRWLRGSDAEISEQERPRFAPAQLKVFDRLPDDAINVQVHETFRKPAQPQMPQTPPQVRQWWPKQREQWLQALRAKVFGGWPNQLLPLHVQRADDVKHDGVRLRAYDFVSQVGVDLRLWLLTAVEVEKPSRIVFTALDEQGWAEWSQQFGPAFRSGLQSATEPRIDEAKFAQTRKTLAEQHCAFAIIAPRGIGPTKWAEPGTPEEIHVRRRFPLLGQTLDGQRVWDVRRSLAVLREIHDFKGVPVWLQGKSEMGGVVLYAALFEPDVARLELWHPPASHRQGPIFLNVRTILDMPQALALAFPKPICVYVKDDAEAKSWEWPLQLQTALGQQVLEIRRVADAVQR